MADNAPIDPSVLNYQAPEFGEPAQTIQIEDIWGVLPQVTTTPTWVPKAFYQGLALNTASATLYYYDFKNNLWRTLANVTVPTGAIVGTTDTQTLTNKRITKRVLAITSSAAPSINTDSYDAVTITALALDITTFTSNLTGTPSNFDTLIIRIKDNGTARALAWGASFEARGVALPTTTVISKVLTVGFLYDTVTSKWGCIASSQEA